MERDLRGTPLFTEVETFYREVLEPGFGKVTGLGDPEPSPDGTKVAFEGTVLDRLEGHAQGRIGVASADGSAWSIVTNGPNDDSGPRWSPDGRTLTFISDRAARGRGQLYALELDQVGEARAMAAVPGVVEHHRWSGDGTRILMVVAGEHAEQSDAKGSGTLGHEAADLPAWVPEVESTDDEDEWRSLWLLELTTGEVRRVSREGLNVWEATWSGADHAVAVVSEAPGEGAWYSATLAVIDLATGKERTVYRSDVQIEFAEGSPDGETIAVIEAIASDRYAIAGDLLLVDASSGDVRRPEIPGDVSSARWRSKRLLVTSLDRLEARASVIEAASGAVRELWRSSESMGGSYQPFAMPLGSDDALVCVRSSSRRPPQLVLVDRGEERILVSTEHPGRERILACFADRRAITWRAPDGWEIDGFLTLPRGEGPFPLLLDVHGGPIGAVTDRFLGVEDAMLVSRGYAILQPNPRGSTGRGRAFAGAVVGDMGGADALDDLAGVDHLVAMGLIDPDRLGVIGGSYGGFMAAWLPTIVPRFKVAVSISPVTDWYSEHFNSSLIDWVGEFLGDVPEKAGGEHHGRSPVFAGDRLRTPTLLTAGSRDRATPPGQAIEMYRALRFRGVPTQVVVYPKEGHGVRDLPAAIDLTARIVGWLDRHLPAA